MDIVAAPPRPAQVPRRDLLLCRRAACRTPLAETTPDGALVALDGVRSRLVPWQRLVLTCPACGDERSYERR